MKKALYEDLYNSEETHWWQVSKRRLSLALMKRFLQVESPRLLDIGCGTGKNMEFFSALAQVWGLDNSDQAIKLSQNKGLQKVILAEAAEIPFRSKSFDLITMLDVLEHLEDHKALREVSRTLKPKGLLVLTVPAYPLLWSEWDVQLHHRCRYNKKDLHGILQKTDLKILKISYMYSFLVIPAILIRTIKSWRHRDNYPSDFKISPPLVNWVANLMAQLESIIIIHSYVPFGLTLIAVAQKV